MITLTHIAAFRDTDTLEKARHGRYADTAKNRRLHRVGQEYGSKKQEDPESEKKPQAQQETEQPKKERNGDSVKRELELLEEHKDSIVEKYGEKAYNKKVESLKKEGEDFEQKETVKELKERADKEDADKVMKEEEEKEQKDKALQEAIKSYKEKQDYLKKEVQAIKDMAKKLKRKVDSEELEDIMYDFEVWMDDYESELKYDIEKEDGLSVEDVQFAIGELEEYALSYYEQDIKGIKEELEELMDEYFPKKNEEPQTSEEYRELGSEMTNKQFRKYLKTPEGKERYEQFLSKHDKILNESRKALEKPQKVMDDFVEKNLPGSEYNYKGRRISRSDRLMYSGMIEKYNKGEGWSQVNCFYYPDNGEVVILPRYDEKGDIEMAQVLSKNNELIDALKSSGKYFSEAYKVEDKLSELKKEYPEMYDKKGRIRDI